MEQSLRPLIEAAQSGEADQELAALEELQLLAEEARGAVTAVLNLVDSPNQQVRELAMAILEDIGAPSVEDVSRIAEFAGSNDADTQYWAATLLMRLRETASAALPALLEAEAKSDAARDRMERAVRRIRGE